MILGAITYLNYFVVMLANIINKPVEKCVYLYYKLEDKYLSFKVDRTYTPNSHEINIDGVPYYANFKLKKDFDNSCHDVSFVSRSTDEEYEKINKKRKR